MRFRLLLLAFLACAAAGPVAARSAGDGPVRGMLLQTERSEALLEEGRAALLAFRMPAAERAFRRLALQPDGAPAAYFHLAQSALLEGLMTGDEARFDVFFERSDSLKRLLDRAPASTWRDYLEAETNLHRAMAAAKTGHYLRAALAARSAYGGFERLVRTQPDFYEAYKGMGLLRVSIGALPRGYRGLLRVLGYGGTVQGGLAALEQAAAHSRFNREEAVVYRAMTRTILYRPQRESVDALRRLHAAHPDSPLFAHLYGFLLLANREAAEAERVLRPAAARADDPAYAYVHYVDYYLADACFKLGRFDEAEAYYRRYLARHDGPALKASTYLGLGLALELQGRRPEALAYYRRVESPRGFDSDAVARRMGGHLLEAPLTGRPRRLLLGRNAFDAGRYAAAVPLLRGVYDDPGADADERAEAAYRLGRVHHAEGRFDEALAAYGDAVARPGAAGTGWAPWSQFYIGEIFAARGETAQAAEAFRRAGAYEGSFDYAQALEQSVRAALERLDAGD